MRSLLLLAAVLALSGCARQPRTAPKPLPRDAARGIAIVPVEDASYIIDPYSQSCFLRLHHWAGGNSMHAVPCDKLKQNLLAAARYITWISAPKRVSDEAVPSLQAPQAPAAPQAPTLTQPPPQAPPAPQAPATPQPSPQAAPAPQRPTPPRAPTPAP